MVVEHGFAMKLYRLVFFARKPPLYVWDGRAEYRDGAWYLFGLTTFAEGFVGERLGRRGGLGCGYEEWLSVEMF